MFKVMIAAVERAFPAFGKWFGEEQLELGEAHPDGIGESQGDGLLMPDGGESHGVAPFFSGSEIV